MSNGWENKLKLRLNAGPYGGSCDSAVLGHYRPTTGARGLNMDLADPKRQKRGGGAVVRPVLGGHQAPHVLKTAKKTPFWQEVAVAGRIDSGYTRVQASRVALGSVPTG